MYNKSNMDHKIIAFEYLGIYSASGSFKCISCICNSNLGTVLKRLLHLDTDKHVLLHFSLNTYDSYFC